MVSRVGPKISEWEQTPGTGPKEGVGFSQIPKKIIKTDFDFFFGFSLCNRLNNIFAHNFRKNLILLM